MSGNQQREIRYAHATVDANGFCTFIFSAPPQGMILTGSISVTDAAAGNTWVLYLGAGPQGDIVTGVPIASTKGTSAIHQVQQRANEILTLQAQNMTPGTVKHCTFHVIGSAEATTPLVWPINTSQASATASDQEVLMPWQVVTIPAGGFIQFTVPLISAARSVTMIGEPLTGGQMGFTVFGTTSGISTSVDVGLTGVADRQLFVHPSVDTSVTAIITGPVGGTCNFALLANTDVIEVASKPKPINNGVALGFTSIPAATTETVFTDPGLGGNGVPTLFVQDWWLSVLTPVTTGTYLITFRIAAGQILFSAALGPSTPLNIVGQVTNLSIPSAGTVTLANAGSSPGPIEADCGFHFSSVV